MRVEKAQVVITGAGPSGAVAAGLLRKAGREVLIIEKETFPRFVIGESLLPHSMTYIEEAGMLQDVVEAGFQYKNGASFCWDLAWLGLDVPGAALALRQGARRRGRAPGHHHSVPPRGHRRRLLGPADADGEVSRG